MRNKKRHSKPPGLLVSPNRITIPIFGGKVKERGLGKTIRKGGAKRAGRQTVLVDDEPRRAKRKGRGKKQVKMKIAGN